jgi:hypothetical protein
MIDFAVDVAAVMVAIWLYDRLQDWRQRRRYHG